MKCMKWMNWIEWINMNELRWMNWYEGIGMNELKRINRNEGLAWRKMKRMTWNAWISMNELKQMNWHEWFEMSDLTWLTWNEEIETMNDMNEFRWMNWHEWIETNELKQMDWNKWFVDLIFKKSGKNLSCFRLWCDQLDDDGGNRWNGALATVARALCRPHCRPHLQKVVLSCQFFMFFLKCKMDFSEQSRAHFVDLIFKKCKNRTVSFFFTILMWSTWWRCGQQMTWSSGYSRAHTLSTSLSTSSSKSVRSSQFVTLFKIWLELSLQYRAHFVDLIFHKCKIKNRIFF